VRPVKVRVWTSATVEDEAITIDVRGMGFAVARYQADLLAFEAALQPLGEDVVGIRYDGLFSLGRSPIDNSRHRADDLVLETGVKCFAHLLSNGSSGCSEFWLVRIAFGWLLRMLVMTRLVHWPSASTPFAH
jgi:hypothetical protein